MSCVLRAEGQSFVADAFLASSPLRPDAVYKKGDPIPARGAASSLRTWSGFALTVSRAGFDELDRQIQDAIEFLDEHEDELRRLGGFQGVESVSLGFGARLLYVAAQTEAFPSDLLWRAGALDISLEITHYAIAPEAPAT